MEHFEIKEFPPFFTGTVPPKWALDFCRVDYENLRQFHLRFRGMDETQLPPLAADKLVVQAFELAKAFPDADHCRASLWLSALESLSADQRLHVQFPRLTESEPADSSIPIDV